MAALAILCVSSSAVAAPKLASHYAAMFEKGHTWSYRLSVTGFDWKERPNGTYKTIQLKPVVSTFRCTVADVVTSAESVTSTIECTQDIDSNYGFRPDGGWVATKDGLYREGDDHPVIAAAPRSLRKKTKDDFGGFYTESITRSSGAWCSSTDTTTAGAGDGGITTMCFRPGGGLASGRNDYHGGIPRIVEYKLAAK